MKSHRITAWRRVRVLDEQRGSRRRPLQALLPTATLRHGNEKRRGGHDLRLPAGGWQVGDEGVKRSRLSLAGVHVHQLVAVLAPHGAAPVELALALGGAAHPQRVVAAAAAHDLAAVGGAGRPVADSAAGAQGPWRGRQRDRVSVSRHVCSCITTLK